MGKSSIVQLTPYDLVAIFIISTIITEPLISTEVIPTIYSSLIVVGFYLLFAKLTLNQTLNKFLLGEPSILIKHGKIVEDTLEKEHISLVQLLAILRNAGYSKLTEVDFAILEPTGFISVIPVPSSRPVTLSDLDIEGQYEGLPLALIVDGKIQKRNLKLIEQDENWLIDKIREKGIEEINRIIYGFVDDQTDELYISLRENISTELNKRSTNHTAAKSKKIYPQENSKNTESYSDNDKNHNFKEKAEPKLNEHRLNNEYSLVKESRIQLENLNKAGLTTSHLKELLGVYNFKDIKYIKLKQNFIIVNQKEEK